MISVIIPIFNIKPYLEYAVNSVIKQSFSDWEMILVDDGSTDGSDTLCDELSNRDTRIRVIHKPNGGLSSARNAGLRIANGDYILFLDGDDYLHSATLSALHTIASNHMDVDFIQFKYKEVNTYFEKEDANEALIHEMEFISSEEAMFQKLFDWGGSAASACTKFYRRYIFDSIHFREGILHEDEDFTTQLLSISQKVAYCKNEFYRYVIRPGSIINSKFTPNKMWAITVVEERIAYLQKKGYEELAQKNEYRLITTLIQLYQLAKKANCVEQQAIIKSKFRKLSRKKNPFYDNHTKILCYLNYFVDALRIRTWLFNNTKPVRKKFLNAETKIKMRYWRWKRRCQLHNQDFTIISNNCWGGLVYQYFGLPYKSPTVGLFIMDDDYIRFLEHFDDYITLPLNFIEFNSSKYHDYLSRESTAKIEYPIAMLGDVEIHFMHYSSKEEAQEKWNRRCKRINKDRMLVKMSQRYVRTKDILDRFSALPFKNKICFTEIDYQKEGFIKIEELKHLNIQGGDETPYVMKVLNLIHLINNIR
jgi:uncharacterized protein (DUF1919 family)